MTEKEKAQNGLLYNPNNDKELLDDMAKTSDLLSKYNLLSPLKRDERKSLIQNIISKIGNNSEIRSPFFCDYGYNIEIGDNFFSNVNLVILDGAKVSIGDNVFIAPNVGIYTAGHPLESKLRNEGIEYAHTIIIGNNVWIGGNVAILPGVTIGNNSVIGAGSVVTKNIPANVLAVGNPCKPIREINND